MDYSKLTFFFLFGLGDAETVVRHAPPPPPLHKFHWGDGVMPMIVGRSSLLPSHRRVARPRREVSSKRSLALLAGRLTGQPPSSA